MYLFKQLAYLGQVQVIRLLVFVTYRNVTLATEYV